MERQFSVVRTAGDHGNVRLCQRCRRNVGRSRVVTSLAMEVISKRIGFSDAGYWLAILIDFRPPSDLNSSLVLNCPRTTTKLGIASLHQLVEPCLAVAECSFIRLVCQVAIGMVRMTHWDEGTELTVETQDGTRTAIVQENFWL